MLEWTEEYNQQKKVEVEYHFKMVFRTYWNAIQSLENDNCVCFVYASNIMEIRFLTVFEVVMF